MQTWREAAPTSGAKNWGGEETAVRIQTCACPGLRKWLCTMKHKFYVTQLHAKPHCGVMRPCKTLNIHSHNTTFQAFGQVGAEPQAGGPKAGWGLCEGTSAKVIIDSENSSELWGRDYYKFGHWQWGHCRGGEKQILGPPFNAGASVSCFPF